MAELLNQQQSRPATTRILCNVLTRLQAAAAASDLLGNELSISHRSLEMYRPTRKPGNPVTVQYLYFLPIFTDPPRFLLTLRLRGGVLSAWAASCHYFSLFSPTFLRVGPPSWPPPHYQRDSSDDDEPPADTHNTDGMKRSAVISLPPSLSLPTHVIATLFFPSSP